MKKILIFLPICFLLVICCGCSLGSTPTMEVNKVLNKYNNQDEEVVVELDDYVNESELNDKQSTTYKEIYLKQFKDMKYDIKEETIDGDNAKVKVQITVYDYYKIEQETNNYLKENPDKFKTNGEYDKSLFIDYKLDKLKSATDRVDYTLEFTLTKVDNKWVVNDLTNEQLEKIHGVYAY